MPIISDEERAELELERTEIKAALREMRLGRAPVSVQRGDRRVAYQQIQDREDRLRVRLKAIKILLGEETSTAIGICI